MSKKNTKPALVVHTTEMMHINQLNPAVYNPNKMAPQEYEALRASIVEHGFVEPIVVQKEGTRIIGGHHRVRALKELALEAAEPIPDIPCIVLDIPDRDAKRLNLKLQHIHGSPDAQLLGELLVDIFTDDLVLQQENVSMLGLEYDDAIKYIRLADPEFKIDEEEETKSDPPTSFGRNPTLSLEFTNPKTRDAVKKLLTEQAEVLKKKSGDVVADRLMPKRKGAKKNGRAHA